MSSVEDLATAAPLHLLATGRFWYRNRGIAVSILVGIFFFVALGKLTYSPGGSGFGYLAPLIQGLTVWGWFWSIHLAAKMDVDDAIARVVESRAARDLGSLKGHVIESMDLSSLGELIPQNPLCADGVIKLFYFILEEARDRKFDSAPIVMQPFREKAFGELFHLQNLQRIALQLGILGTFIGLVQGLLSLKEGLTSALEPARLGGLISSLHVSFGTSIAGLEVAVSLGVVLLALRSRQQEFFDRAEGAAVSLLALARRAENVDEYLVEFEQIRTMMRQLGDKVQGQSLAVKNQTQEIEAGLGRLVAVKLQFDEFLEKVRGEQDKVLEEMRSVYEIISPAETAKQLEESLCRAIELSSERFRSGLQDGLGELERVQAVLKDLGAAMDQLHERASDQSDQMIESRLVFQNAESRLETIVSEMVELHGGMLERSEKASRLDVEKFLHALVSTLGGAQAALETRLREHMAMLERQAAGHRRSIEHVGHLLETMLDRPSFFYTVLVRPWRMLRMSIAGLSTSRS